MIDLKDNLDMEMITRTINLVRTIITNSLNFKQLIQTTEKPKGILDFIYLFTRKRSFRIVR